VHEVLPLERAADAHRIVESDAAVGKVVLLTAVLERRRQRLPSPALSPR